MSKKRMSVEMEKVTIELPKAIMDFLRSVEPNPEKYVQDRLLEVFRADLDTCTGVWGYGDVVMRFNLEPIFDAMNTVDAKRDC